MSEPARIFRVRFAIAGGHVHCRVFSAPHERATYAKLGDLVVTKGAEFRDLVDAFQKAEFLGDDPAVGIAAACTP